MKRILIMLLCLGLVGCSTANVNYMRNSGQGSLVDTFDNSKDEIFTVIRESVPMNDLIIRKEDYDKGIIVATPDRAKTLGKRLGSVLVTPLFASSYNWVYFYVTPVDDRTKLEIVETYDNPMNPGRDYKAGLMNTIKAKLQRPDKMKELKELFDMKEKGLITEEDYNLKKREMLGIK